jgi:hypothetical protein
MVVKFCSFTVPEAESCSHTETGLLNGEVYWSAYFPPATPKHDAVRPPAGVSRNVCWPPLSR